MGEPARPLERVPAPPRELSKEARRIWRRLAGRLVEGGRLTELDLDQLELYCDALVKLRAASDALGVGLVVRGRRDEVITSPVWKVYRELLATCRALGAAFGLTPGARAGSSAVGDAAGNSSSKARTASDCIEGRTWE